MSRSIATRFLATRPGSTARADLLGNLDVEQRRLEVRGMTTSLLEGGRGRPLILLHGGIQAGGSVWWRVLPHLLSAHRIVVPDLPGLGDSESRQGELDPTWVVSWLEELIASTCEQPPTLIAHSAPAAFAARVAIRSSDRLRGLVLVDSAGLARKRPPLGVLASAIRSVTRPSERSFDRFMRNVMYDLDHVREQSGAQWADFAAYTLEQARIPATKKAMRSVVKGGLQAIPEADLREITTPVALIWGRHDRLLPLQIAEGAAATFGWPLHVIADAGHLPHVERPREFVDSLEAAIGDA